MPNEASHITLACHNQAVINYLLEAGNNFPDWLATIAFYKALHIVEALFANNKDIEHGRSHEKRESHLKFETRYTQIYKHYRPLWAASMVARYLQAPRHVGGKKYSKFTDYLSVEQVKSELLQHRLLQLQKSAARFLSPQAQKVLARHSPPKANLK